LTPVVSTLEKTIENLNHLQAFAAVGQVYVIAVNAEAVRTAGSIQGSREDGVGRVRDVQYRYAGAAVCNEHKIARDDNAGRVAGSVVVPGKGKVRGVGDI